MTVMTDPAIPRSAHRTAGRAGGILLFWVLGALAVAAVDQSLAPLSPTVCVAAKLAAILIAGFGYMRWCGRDLGAGHALLVGVSWFMLDVAAEVALTEDLGRGWFGLLGSPAQPVLRLVLLFTWLVAPALFAASNGSPDDTRP